MRNGSGNWPPSSWTELLRLTIEAIGSVADDQSVWSFGGGTSLSIDLGHRVSYDIDAFLDSAKLLRALVPNTNQVTRRICWNDVTQRADFQWPGSYLKLSVRDKGEIDFLNVGSVVDEPNRAFEFEGTLLQRERPAEIIAKKLRYRGSQFKARDAFDLAAVYLAARDELLVAAQSPLLDQLSLKRAAAAISLKGDNFQRQIEEEVNPTEFGTTFLHEAKDIAAEALNFMQRHLKPVIEEGEEFDPRLR